MQLIRNLSLALMSLMASPAFAASVGGLDKAKSLGEEIKTGLYALLGVGATIYLIYLAFMAFTEKKTWADFGWGVVYVCIAGGVTALATWAWSAFT
ncbi:MAG: TrbC/VirB2 family protein [Azoarcus sp.]|jgi:hypothetical protein|nr:TrbC/VirB2 family protein [Azoarcus sp.]